MSDMDNMTLSKLSSLSEQEYIQMILDMTANEVDYEIQNKLMKELINKYVQISNEYKTKLDEIEQLSLTDTLTKIYNRMKFNREGIAEEKRFKRYGKPFAVIMMDIDHFKRVNDNFGHDIGDVTLIRFAKTVNHVIRETDLLARWGGEEFICLVPETSQKEVMILAERIRKAIEEEVFEKVEHITVSIGASLISKGESLDMVIKRADEAMYKAKDSGRNRVEIK